MNTFSFSLIRSVSVSLAIVFFCFLSVSELSSQETSDDIQLYKQISSTFINRIIAESETIDEIASRVGVTVEELRLICRDLSIDLSAYERIPDYSLLPSVQKLSSDEFEPDVIISYNGDSPYILLVEKSVHKIYLIKQENGTRTLEAVFDCKTGKNMGDKKEEGDHKTPEGIFFLVNRYSRNRIRSLVGSANAYQYGDMAFATNYPNYIDILNNKNGGGIWLHGTDEPFTETSSLDTRGCVVTTNETIQTLSKYIQLRETPIVIVDTLEFNDKNSHEIQKKQLLAILEGWRSAWQEKRMEDYIGYYAPLFSEKGRNRSAWQTYKASIFRSYDIYHINLENIIVLKYKDGMVAKFDQDYAASNLSSEQSKMLYFANNRNSWEIIAEKIQ